MDPNRKQDIALMRYAAIAPLITGTQEDYPSLSAYFRETSARGVLAPDGTLRHYSPATLQKWYLAYRKNGFEALVPASRKIDQELKEQQAHLPKDVGRSHLPAASGYGEHPQRTSLGIHHSPLHQPDDTAGEAE